MRCAHCKDSGPAVTVAHVKACSQAEQAIRSIGAAPVAPKVKTLAEEPVEGFYERDGHYFKVVQSENTGNWYAYEGEPHEGQKIEWEYAGRRPLHHLTADNRLTAEEAARLGHLTGRCVFCSRKLTDDRSTEVGYGPICADREGLPWG